MNWTATRRAQEMMPRYDLNPVVSLLQIAASLVASCLDAYSTWRDDRADRHGSHDLDRRHVAAALGQHA